MDTAAVSVAVLILSDVKQGQQLTINCMPHDMLQKDTAAHGKYLFDRWYNSQM